MACRFIIELAYVNTVVWLISLLLLLMVRGCKCVVLSPTSDQLRAGWAHSVFVKSAVCTCSNLPLNALFLFS